MTAQEKTAVRPFVISRLLDAPRERVWQAWTDSASMQWWEPKGVTVHHAKMDLRPGGLFHYCMHTPDGHKMWGKWLICEIQKHEQLLFINSFSDEAGGFTRHPMNANWPLKVLSKISFTPKNGKTLLTIHWEPFNASDVESKTFDDSHESMRNGWTGTLDSLTSYLAENKK